VARLGGDLLSRLARSAADVCDPSLSPEAWRAAAVRAELASAERARDAYRVEELAAAYDRLLTLVPQVVSGLVVWRPVAAHGRRRLGAFATPRVLAEAVVDRALPSPSAGLAVVDPACGTGALLVAVLDRLVDAGVVAETALSSLHGVDVDPIAVELARARLAWRAAELADMTGAVVDVEALAAGCAVRIRCGDALVDGAEMTWSVTFGQVLATGEAAVDPVTGWTGGFDAVVANPPWERLKIPAAEHLSGDLAVARDQVREVVRAVRQGGRHPLTGAGDLNEHLPFVETCWRLLAPGGRAALLVPEAAVTDRQAGRLVEALLDAADLESVHALGEWSRFDGTVTSARVALMTLRRNETGAAPGGGDGAEVITRVDDPRRPALDRAWRLTPSLVGTINPSTRTAVLLDSAVDVRLVGGAHERNGVLLRRDRGEVVDDPWGFRARTPIHLSREAAHVRTAPDDGLVPLGEAKLAGLLDPRAATYDDGTVRPATDDELADPAWTPATRWWVPAWLVRDRYGDLLARGWLGACRVVTTTRTARTLLPVALPAGAYANSLALVTAPRLPLVLAAFASLPLDYVARAKLGGNNLNLFKLEQLPVPPPDAYDVAWPGLPAPTLGHLVLSRLAVAVRWCSGLAPLADELAADDIRRAATLLAPSDATRSAALADLDAVHAHLLGWTAADLEHVLATFGALRSREEAQHGRFVTRERVLEAFERLTPPA
jgi:SAM-dependent methyltransferase